MVFLNDFFLIPLFFGIKQLKYNFDTFWGPGLMSIHKNQQFLEGQSFFDKIKLSLYPQVKNSMTQPTL